MAAKDSENLPPTPEVYYTFFVHSFLFLLMNEIELKLLELTGRLKLLSMKGQVEKLFWEDSLNTIYHLVLVKTQTPERLNKNV